MQVSHSASATQASAAIIGVLADADIDSKTAMTLAYL